MSNSVTIFGSDGEEEFPVARFVNGERVKGDLVMPPPQGFRRVPQVVRVDLRDMRDGGDVYNVGGGKVGLSGRVYAKLRAQAGINVVKTTVEPVELDGKAGVQVTVWGVRHRPGRPMVPVCKSVAATYEDALKRAGKTPEADVRMFLPRKLETAALNRLTRDMLGEPTAYTKAELDAGQGCLLVVADVPDPADPAVRDIMVRQALGAGQELYALPSQSALPPAAPVEALEGHEFDTPPAGESRGEGPAAPEGGAGGLPPSQQNNPSDAAGPNDPPEAEWEDLEDSKPTPDWVKNVPTDPTTGELVFQAFDAANLKLLIMAGIKETDYPNPDPKGFSVRANWKDKKATEAAQELYRWSMGGAR